MLKLSIRESDALRKLPNFINAQNEKIESLEEEIKKMTVILRAIKRSVTRKYDKKSFSGVKNLLDKNKQ